MNATQATATAAGERRARLVIFGAWGTAIGLGLRHAWHGRYEIMGDAVSYLDIGQAFAQGDWANAINGYWSPLYPWALGVAVAIARADPQHEFVVIALVNVLMYLIALIAFGALLKELTRWRDEFARRNGGGRPLPAWVWLALCYLVFMWSSLHVLSVSDITPDMAFAAVVYLCTTLLLRLARGDTSWRAAISLGAALGIGFWIKVPMIGLAPVFLACAFIATRPFPRGFLHVAGAALVFGLVIAPLAAALSWQKGRLTIGDSPRLNLAWNMNHVPRSFWLGGPPDLGYPVHPPRKIHESPPAFEFARAIPAAYPPWHDPAYWYEGVTPRWNARGLRESLIESRMVYERLLRSQSPFVAAIVCLVLLGGNVRRWLTCALALWPMWIIAAAGLCLFAVVHVETRYIGQYLALAMAAALTVVRVQNRSARAAGVLTIVLAFSVARPVALRAISPYDASGVARTSVMVAQALREVGVRPGDRAALLRAGRGGGAYWARLAGVQIVAETPSADAFWRAEQSARLSVIAAMADTGARVLVASELPKDADSAGWLRLGRTNWHAYRLDR